MPDRDLSVATAAASEPDAWERYLTEPVRDRKVIIGFELLAASTGLVRRLHAWGAQRPLVIADGRGTGPVPEADEADIVMVDGPASTSLTDEVRTRMRPEERLTADLRSAVERYDPGHEAWWWASPLAPNEPVLGRSVLGGRPRAQAALEDKLLVDGLLEAVEAARSPARITTAAYESLMAATHEVVEECGGGEAVWVGDNRGGINGGGDYVRWVRSPEQARAAADFFAERCDRVRVVPFLEGVPCSVHGIVLPDGVVVLRPLELVSLRDPDSGTFVYAGLGSAWSPPEPDAAEIRELARRIGQHLALAHGYRGAFGIDGVLTEEGYRVTELNARLSAGLARIHRSAPSAQLELVHLNALIGRDVGRTAAEVEQMALDELAQDTFAVAFGVSSRRVFGDDESVDLLVRAGEDGFETATSADIVVGSVLAGPTTVGSFFRFTPLDGTVGPGDRAAPLSILLYEFANRTWNAGLPVGQIPPDVRTERVRRPIGEAGIG